MVILQLFFIAFVGFVLFNIFTNRAGTGLLLQKIQIWVQARRNEIDIGGAASEAS